MAFPRLFRGAVPAFDHGVLVGVALFGSLVGQSGAFMAGLHKSLIISACVLLAAGAVIWRGAPIESE